MGKINKPPRQNQPVKDWIRALLGQPRIKFTGVTEMKNLICLIRKGQDLKQLLRGHTIL